MIKLIPNRMSDTMTLDKYNEFMMHMTKAYACLLDTPAVADEVFSRLAKKGDVRRIESEQLFVIVKEFFEFLPSPTALADLEKDHLVNEQLYQLYQNHVAPINRAFMIQLGLSGAEEINMYSWFAENVKNQAAANNPRAIECLNRLDKVNPNKGGSAANRKKK